MMNSSCDKGSSWRKVAGVQIGHATGLGTQLDVRLTLHGLIDVHVLCNTMNLFADRNHYEYERFRTCVADVVAGQVQASQRGVFRQGLREHAHRIVAHVIVAER